MFEYWYLQSLLEHWEVMPFVWNPRPPIKTEDAWSEMNTVVRHETSSYHVCPRLKQYLLHQPLYNLVLLRHHNDKCISGLPAVNSKNIPWLFTYFSLTFDWISRINWHINFEFCLRNIPSLPTRVHRFSLSKFKFHQNTKALAHSKRVWVVVLKLTFRFETRDCSGITTYKSSCIKFPDVNMTFPINHKIPCLLMKFPDFSLTLER